MLTHPLQGEEGAQPINALKMDRNTLEMALQKAIQGEVRFDAVSRMLYRTDASIYEMEPLGLVVPKDEADVVAAVKIAAEQGAAVLPRGGGTSLAGQSVGAAVHLDFSKYMNRILEFSPDERWARVQPGLVLDELNAYLQPYGLIFAPDVSTSSRANIGGMIGNNSCGAHSMIYGKTIDHVLELKVVLADGSQAVLGPLDDEECERRAGLDGLEGRIYREIRRIVCEREAQIRAGFPEVMRRVSGYNLDEFIDGAPFDLSKLVVGSEGTLCAVVEARLNLVELPAHKGLVAVHFHDLIEAMEANLTALETCASRQRVDGQNFARPDQGLARTRPEPPPSTGRPSRPACGRVLRGLARRTGAQAGRVGGTVAGAGDGLRLGAGR